MMPPGAVVAGVPTASSRAVGLAMAVEKRVVNPLVERLLRSRVHWLASRALTLLTYRGRHSGREYTLTVAYARRDETVVVLTPESATNWWRNFREPRACTLQLAGRRRSAVGEVVTDPAARARLGAVYAGQRRLLAKLLGVNRTASSDGAPFGHDLVVLRFSLASGPSGIGE